MRDSQAQRWLFVTMLASWSLLVHARLWAGEQRLPPVAPRPQAPQLVLTPAQWQQLDQAVDRGLEFLARQQRPDGSFESPGYAQPAITSLCVMAFLSRGHTPGEGPYGVQIVRAVDFVLTAQQSSGLLFALPQGHREWSKGSYNHAIAGVMLGEVYGMTDAPQQERIKPAIASALAFTRQLQQRPKQFPEDRGGWKYLTTGHRRDADLSVTVWQLMFYRSALNAGFEVPEADVNTAVEFVKRCFDDRRGTFKYGLASHGRNQISRAMAGAGILSLSLAGEHESEMSRRTARFLLARPFDAFNREPFDRDQLGQHGRYFYAAYHCSQGMHQIGGDEWKAFYSVLLKALVENQRSDGSWEPDAMSDAALGSTYSTALAVLALTPPYQLLPVYQR